MKISRGFDFAIRGISAYDTQTFRAFDYEIELAYDYFSKFSCSLSIVTVRQPKSDIDNFLLQHFEFEKPVFFRTQNRQPEETSAHPHSRLGDRDCLLFHGLVDGHLIARIHLVKLVNTTHALKQTATNRLQYCNKLSNSSIQHKPWNKPQQIC